MHSIIRTIALSVALACLATAASATIWSVPGDMSGTCTIVTPSCDTLADAVAASSNSDTIQVAAGTFASSNLHVDKSLTIEGAGPASTFLEPNPGDNAMFIDVSGVVVRNLTIRNATGTSDGVRISIGSTTIDDTEFNNVHFSNNASDGLELSTPASSSITDLRVIGCTFSGNNNGIRMASTSVVDGMSVSGSTFDSNVGVGLYQANDGGTSQLKNLSVATSVFTNNGTNAIYAEEIQDSTIETSTFTGNGRGVLIFKGYTTSGVAVQNVAIRDNDFTDSDLQAVEIVTVGSALGGTIDIEDNTIDHDAGALTAAVGAIDIRLDSAFSGATVNVTNNSVAFSGTITTAAAYGIAVRGNGPVSITGNRLDGGGVGGAGTTPPTSGVYIRSIDGFFGTIPASATITATCNRITGFTNGVSVFDAVGNGFGGLLPGTSVSFNDGVISGNTAIGVANGASPPTIDAEDNWWGCIDGPGNVGCDSISGDVDADPVAVSPPACVSCQQDVECSDTVECNGGETCTSAVCSAPTVCPPACPSTPTLTCRAAEKSILLMKAPPTPEDKLIWKWVKGDETMPADFGDPQGTTPYALCVYAGSSAALIADVIVAGGAGWSPIGTKGYKYKDADGVADGVRKIVLKAGDQGKAKSLLKGKGDNMLDSPPLTLPIDSADFPVIAELYNLDTDLCWGSSFAESDVKKNDEVQFKAKAQ